MNKKLLRILIYSFAIEKALQHLITALFFIVDIPGIGTPDIGNTFQIQNSTMAILNLVYFLLFIIGIWGNVKHKIWAIPLMIVLSFLDIILEFIFHHFFFITVSVLVSILLIVVSLLYRKKDLHDKQ